MKGLLVELESERESRTYRRIHLIFLNLLTRVTAIAHMLTTVYPQRTRLNLFVAFDWYLLPSPESTSNKNNCISSRFGETTFSLQK